MSWKGRRKTSIVFVVKLIDCFKAGRYEGNSSSPQQGFVIFTYKLEHEQKAI